MNATPGVRWALLLAPIALLAGAPAADAQEPAPPPCSAADTETLVIGNRGFVATRSDNGFSPSVVETPGGVPAAGIAFDSFTYSVPPPASVIVTEEGARVDAPLPGPLPITATWVKSARSGVCTATGTAAVTVLPVRIPTVRREAAEQPVAIGPTLSWPCPDELRATNAPGTIVVRYERGLAKAPGPASPSATVKLETPCELNLSEQADVRGVLAVGAGDFRREPTRKALAIFPERARDLRVAIDIRWGDTQVFSHEYAIVSVGRRREEDGRRTPVFLTTEPAAAAAAARRYARQRRGKRYVSPEQRAARRPRSYVYSISGSFTTDWAGELGTAGEPGCGFVRETGTDRAKFSLRKLDPTAGGLLRGTIDRTYVETRECVPMRSFGPAFTCPQHAALGGSVDLQVVPDGALTIDGHRVRGSRLLLGLFGDIQADEGFCPGWGGVLPSFVLDAPAKNVARLRKGRRATVRLARTIDCRDAIIEARGEPTACTARVAATVVVKRVG